MNEADSSEWTYSIYSISYHIIINKFISDLLSQIESIG